VEAIVPSSRPGRGGGTFLRKAIPPSRESRDVGNDTRYSRGVKGVRVGDF
jgi:hypothetical protein